jgi:hypothetical protein
MLRRTRELEGNLTRLAVPRRSPTVRSLWILLVAPQNVVKGKEKEISIESVQKSVCKYLVRVVI